MVEPDQLMGRLLATQETLLRTVEKLEAKIDAQAHEIQELKETIASLRAGGRVLLWVASVFGAFSGAVATWAWRFWQAVQN